MEVKGVRFWTGVGIPILAPSILRTFSILFANAIAAYATPYALLWVITIPFLHISNFIHVYGRYCAKGGYRKRFWWS